MSLDTFDVQASECDTVDYLLNLTGNATSQPTKNFGKNITLNRTGVGIIDVTWVEYPGVYVGVKGHCFEAATQSGVKGFTVVAGSYSATTKTLTINVTNSGETLTDLSTVQRLTMTFTFKKTNA